MGRGGGALFLPLALTGSTALRATGAVPERLSRWIAGAVQATLAALLHLDRVRDWQARAQAETRGLSGRTPPALIAALAAWPMVSAPMAEEITGASRAAVQRNLDTLSQLGLIREVTGQGRYRIWAAAM
jgi:Fic family protein